MEIFDLYDINRRKTKRTMIRGKKTPKNFYRTIIHVCIFNSKNEMLIQQRQTTKRGWADLWDFSVSGSVKKGETSQRAARREVNEELGVDLDFRGVRPDFTINFKQGFDDFYTFTEEIDINDVVIQEEEVQDCKWATKEEIYKLIDENKFIPYTKSLIEMLYFTKEKRGIHTNSKAFDNGKKVRNFNRNNNSHYYSKNKF
ncbi:NUDIX domain-containing protein [Helcococcus bovis]|uniref:NUDIX hydrolase n=1 Tax=Helcococcus bovis TaxID=3153252 RepID=UPI0038BA7215